MRESSVHEDLQLAEYKVITLQAEQIREEPTTIWIMSRHFEKSKALLREVRHGRKTLSNNRSDYVHGREGRDGEKDQCMRLETTQLWIPHPRTGIYYPKGHECTMEDIPKGAARFKQPYWLRNSEGTDTPIVDPFMNM